MMQESLYGLLSFSVFVIIQSVFINGVHASFSGRCTEDIEKGRICNGLIFFPLAIKMDKALPKWMTKPLYGCVRCMSSLWGGATFWGTVLPVFGFRWWEVFVFIADVFILVVINFWIYKKLS